jgi:hypothetical protein
MVLILAAVFLHLNPQPSQAASSQRGYLWWSGDPAESVVLYDDQHQDEAGDLQTLQQWEDGHTACLTDGGTPAKVIGGGQLTFAKVSVQPTAGPCAGFRGWVPSATWHDGPP